MKKLYITVLCICSFTQLIFAQCLSINVTDSEPACAGSTGSLTLNISGGTTPYTYMWQSGETMNSSTGLMAGCYRVTVTENGGCSVDSLICLQNSFGPTITYLNSTDASCFASSDGVINTNVSGGTWPYSSIMWYNEYGDSIGSGATGILFLPGNRTYYEVVMDNAGCIGVLSSYIREPTPMQSSVVAQTNLSCAGDNNGDATVTASGGTVAGSYTYSWPSSGQTTVTGTGLSAGVYPSQIFDDNGCSIITQVTITEPSTLSVWAISTDASCNDGSNGTVTATSTSGGTSPYNYVWSDNGQTTQIVTGLPIGVYTVTATDQNGCMDDYSVNISAPSMITATPFSTSSTCSTANGIVYCGAVSGGMPPYSYNWDYGSNSTSSATGLTVGIYSVTVGDANSCSFFSTATVTDIPGAVSAGFTTVTMPCFGESTGSLLANVTGGTSPLTYQWDDGLSQNTAQANSLVSNNYNISITDNNGCVLVMTDSLPQYDELLVSLVTPNPQLCAGQTDSISAQITGGLAPYSVNWSVPGFVSVGPHPVTPNPSTITTYICTVTDGASCSQIETAIYTVGSELLINGPDTLGVCHDDFILSGTGFGGTAISDYHWEWNTGFTEDSVIASVYLASPTQQTFTTFSVTLTDGCSDEASWAIVAFTQPPIVGDVTVFGGVYYQGSAVNSGTVYLIEMIPALPFYTYSDTTLISNGFYSFQNIPQSDYVIYVVPDTTNYPGAVPYYYGNTHDWSSATILDFSENCNGNVHASTYLDPIPLLITGNGQLSGVILETTRSGFQFANNMVSLRDIATDEILAFDVTDELGRYRLRDIDVGNYHLIVEFPGYTNDYTNTVEFLTSSSNLHQNICVDNGNLSFTPCNLTTINDGQSVGLDVQVYPNPFSQSTTIKFDNTNNLTYQLDIYSIQGTLVKSLSGVTDKNVEVYRNNMSVGLYYFTLGTNDNQHTGKFVIE